ncbi:P-loop containing nucleoside triphosphate hydrolase [Pseudocohnilembus persalinus]|uniref:p-loop containing nucleoside triphosphate hydrolase n=1 Tax=Pseudocohnilembus persalinus TaxID=266149 RepID=A0A0V0QME1_PSEPJ|nr:P-loop containing nucleoside triphosphate hydrolase [Pseudocohnilembus persalinus]|eukprot:KRX03398.1 P-loop containing nucleoside triphosphate hydrolase [Pseudocohnilembus persalinus]
MQIEQIINNNQNIQEGQAENSLQILQKVLDWIKSLGVPCQFHKIENELKTFLTVGITGSGKSTGNNAISKIESQKNNIIFDKKDFFQTGQSSTSVTKKVQAKIIANLRLIDSPGLDDPDKNLSNSTISDMTCKFLNKEVVYDKGLNGIIQCIQLNNSQRIDNTTVKCMQQILLAFTMNYPEFNYKNCPRINVLFNNVTEQEYEMEIEDQNCNDFNFSSEQDKSEKFDKNDCIRVYKQFLLEAMLKDCLIEQYSIDEQQTEQTKKKLKTIINTLLPPENFYAFKIFKNDKQKMEKEVKVIQKLIKDNKAHGNFVLKKNEEGTLNPVFIQDEVRYEVIQLINAIILGCQEQLQQANSNFVRYTGQNCEKFQQLLQKINKFQQEFENLIRKTPQSLLKTPILVITYFQNQLKTLNQIIADMTTQEIGKYSQQERQKMNKKLEEQHQKFAEMEQKMFKQLAQAEDELKLIKHQNEQNLSELNQKLQQQKQKMQEAQAQHQQENEQLQLKMDQIQLDFYKAQSDLEQEQQKHSDNLKHQQKAYEQQKKQLQQQLEEQRKIYEQQNELRKQEQIEKERQMRKQAQQIEAQLQEQRKVQQQLVQTQQQLERERNNDKRGFLGGIINKVFETVVPVLLGAFAGNKALK